MWYIELKCLLICFVITLTVLKCGAQDIQQVTVTAGDDVTLSCTSAKDYPKWTGPELHNGYIQQYNNDGQSSFPNQNVPEQKRLRLRWGNDRKSLIISDVIISDQGQYQCVLARRNLSIRVPPRSPVLSNTEPSTDGTLIIRTSESKTTSLVCISSGGYPQPLVQWYRESTTTQPLNSSSTVVNETNSFLVNQTYTFSPQRQDDGVQYICKSSFRTAPRHIATTSAKLLLNLKPNPPTVVQTAVVAAGNQAIVKCNTTGSRPAASITWSYKNTSPIGEQTSTLDSVTNTYTVVSVLKLPVTAEDNGQTVQCKVTHTLLVNQAELTASVNLNVQFSVQASSTKITGNRLTNATGSTSLTLNCTTGSSNPASDIKWYNGSSEITNTDLFTTWTGENNGHVRSQLLVFHPSRYMDGDAIRCSVTNILNSQSPVVGTTTLNLQYRPLINPMSSKTSVEGDNMPFTCTASSKPVSMFKWYRDGQHDPLIEGNGTLEHNGLTYTIYNVKRTDAATYLCNANNGIETPDNKNVLLTVHYPPDVQPMAKNTTVNASRIVITCNATGVPNTGYKYGKWTQRWPGYDSSVREYPNENVIELQNLTYEHSGVYTCSASNGIKIFGTETEVIEGSVYLIVESFPVITNCSDKVSAKLKENVTVDVYYYSNVAGTDVKINKNTNSSEKESVIYSVNPTTVQVALPVFNHKIETTGTKARIIIQIKSQKDLGFYDIVVFNKIGLVKRSLEIVPKGPPSVPSNLTVDNIQFNSVRVSWIAGYHGGAEQTFVIQISSDNVNWKNKSEVDGGLDESADPVSGIISKLSASTTYYVRMYAYNKEGPSQFTDILNYTTSAEIDNGNGAGSMALIGGLCGGGAAVILIIVVVLIVFKRKGTFTKGKAKRYQENSDRKPVQEDEDDYGMKENPMYVSAGPRGQAAGGSGGAGAVYSTVDKKKNVPDSNKNDVYAEVDKSKTTKESVPDNVYSMPIKPKGKKEKEKKEKNKRDNVKDKKGKKAAQEGDIYENATPANQSKNDEIIYENPEPSKAAAKKNVNKDGLIYADLTFNDQPKGQKKLVIHGLDDMTEYVQVDFTKKAEPLPDSDDENNPPK